MVENTEFKWSHPLLIQIPWFPENVYLGSEILGFAKICNPAICGIWVPQRESHNPRLSWITSQGRKRSGPGFVTLMFFTFKKSWWKNNEFFLLVFPLFFIILTIAVVAILHFPLVVYPLMDWCHLTQQCQFTRWIQFLIAISNAPDKENKVKDLYTWKAVSTNLAHGI